MFVRFRHTRATFKGEKEMAKICIVRRAYYPNEYHVRRNASALVKAGHEVDIICLKARGQKVIETIDGVNIYRLPVGSSRIGVIQYGIEYSIFFFAALFMVTLLHISKRYDFVEADSMPEALIFCGIIPKLTGSKLILYLFESMPELWAQTTSLSIDSLPIRLLKYHEFLSCRFADKVICCHEMAKEAVVSRGTPAEKITSILNVPDEALFNLPICKKCDSSGKEKNKKIIIVQHGTITETYGIQYVIEALSLLKNVLPIEYHICGKGEYWPELEKMIDQLGINSMIKYHGYVSFDELMKILCSADAGIVPMLNEYQSPNKMFELISLGKPIIASDLKTIRQHFSEESILYFKKGDVQSIKEILLLFSKFAEKDIEKLTNNATKEYRNYKWEIMKNLYIDLYKNE